MTNLKLAKAAEIQDPLERIIAQALSSASVPFLREGERHQGVEIKLDFYLPDHDIYIECKAFHTPRSALQLEMHKSVILIQSLAAAKFFAALITPRRGAYE